MKKVLFFLSAACMLMITACEIETSGNGNLDGYWHLDQIDSLSNNTIVNYGDRNIFWSFQSDLLQLSNLSDKPIIYKFILENATLTLSNPCLFDRTTGDSLITDVDVLRPYGVNAIPEYLKVAHLNNSNLTIESPILRLHFKKY